MSKTEYPKHKLAASQSRGLFGHFIGNTIAAGILFSIANFLWILPAQAQQGLEPPPSFQTIDQFGVDLVSGQLSVSSPTISVGDPTGGGLSFTAIWDSRVRTWRYGNWGSVKKEIVGSDPYCFAFYTLVYMGQSNIFQRDSCGSLNFDLIDGFGGLVETGSGYTYTAIDGSIAIYVGTTNTANISTISRPNGEVITYSYSSSVLRSVSNNFGYQLFFEHASGQMSKVTALNNAVDACGLTATSCTFSTSWPSLTFTTSGVERRVTDGLGRTTRIIFDSADPVFAKIVGVSRPTRTSGSSVAYTQTFIPCGGTRVTSVTDGTGTWTYAYDVNAPDFGDTCLPLDWDAHHTSVTDPSNGVTTYTIYYAGRSYWSGDLNQQFLLLPSLYSIKNALNQTTLVSQSAVGLHGVGFPEGNGLAISRTDNGNVREIRTVSKPGSGLADTYVTAVYPNCVVEPIRCHFPTSVTIPRTSATDFTNVTDYTYDAAGNVLTQTGPAPSAGAARPQTRYTWAQRYAWYKRNGASTITRAASPVWVMTSQSQCLTTTSSCVGSSLMAGPGEDLSMGMSSEEGFAVTGEPGDPLDAYDPMQGLNLDAPPQEAPAVYENGVVEETPVDDEAPTSTEPDLGGTDAP